MRWNRGGVALRYEGGMIDAECALLWGAPPPCMTARTAEDTVPRVAGRLRVLFTVRLSPGWSPASILL